jgi:hypothetical protein
MNSIQVAAFADEFVKIAEEAKKSYEELEKEELGRLRKAKNFEDSAYVLAPAGAAFGGITGLAANELAKGMKIPGILRKPIAFSMPVVGAYLGARQAHNINKNLPISEGTEKGYMDTLKDTHKAMHTSNKLNYAYLNRKKD